MSQVWECRLDHPEQSILLAMADHANDYGGNCFPSIEYLAWKTGYSERQVKRIGQGLRLRGVLVITAPPTRTTTTEYCIDLSVLPLKPPFISVKKLSLKKRAEVIAEHNETCSYCNKPGDSALGPDGQLWHIDRIIPGAKGGQYTDENITLACGTCNRKKKDKMASQFIAEQLRNGGPSEHLRGPFEVTSEAVVTAPLPLEPSLQPIEPHGSKPAKAQKKKAGSITNPNVAMFKRVTGHRPRKVIEEKVCKVMGYKPDEARLKLCYQTWIERGYNEYGMDWLYDWYLKNFIPERTFRKGKHEAIERSSRADINKPFKTKNPQ